MKNSQLNAQSDRILQEGIISQLFYGTQEERFKEIMRKIETVIKENK